MWLQALQQAGCFAIVLECLPPIVAEALTKELSIPTIGIGAGPHCSGQVILVMCFRAVLCCTGCAVLCCAVAVL